jgi:membrane protease YdiL (CAAX protease family)
MNISARCFVGAGCAAYLLGAVLVGLASGYVDTERIFASVVFAFFEEWLFRKWLLTVARKRMALWKAILVSSVAFAAIHLSPSDYAFFFAMGIFFCWIFLYTKSLWVTAAFHAAHNLVLYTVRAPNWTPLEITQNQILGLVFITECVVSAAIGIALLRDLRRNPVGSTHIVAGRGVDST